jgi:hypothetical protein
MDTRGIKRRRNVDLSSEDEFDDIEDTDSEDVMCSQYVYNDVFHDKSSDDDDDMLSQVCFILFCLFMLYLCNFFVRFIFWWFIS